MNLGKPCSEVRLTESSAQALRPSSSVQSWAPAHDQLSSNQSSLSKATTYLPPTQQETTYSGKLAAEALGPSRFLQYILQIIFEENPFNFPTCSTLEEPC